MANVTVDFNTPVGVIKPMHAGGQPPRDRRQDRGRVAQLDGLRSAAPAPCLFGAVRVHGVKRKSDT